MTHHEQLLRCLVRLPQRWHVIDVGSSWTGPLLVVVCSNCGRERGW